MKILATFAFVLAATAAAADPPHPSLPAPVVPEALGAAAHFFGKPSSDWQPGEAQMIAAGGFRWVRAGLVWAVCEREKGQYDFSPAERMLDGLQSHGVRAMLTFDYGNPLYGPSRAVVSEEGRQAFARWAAATAAHFKGRGVLWEIWNEPNGLWKPDDAGPYKPDIEQYIALALATCKAVHEAAPGEAITGPGLAGMDFGFLEACFKAGLLDEWDAVTVHPYRSGGPEGAVDRYLSSQTGEGNDEVAVEYARLRRLIARYAPRNKTIPILCSEWGYSSEYHTRKYGPDPDASVELQTEAQAKMLPREWLINLANQIPLSIWYEWHDDGTTPRDAEDHYGTVTCAYHPGRDPVCDPKPAYRAAQTLTTALAGCRFAKQLAVGRPDDFAMLFQKEDQLRLAVWTTAHEPHPVTLPCSPGSFELVSYTGEQRSTVAVEGNRLTITASDAPQYLLFNAANPTLAGVPAIHPLRATLTPVAGTTLAVHVENLTDTAFQGRARLVDVDGLEPAATEQPLEFAAGQAEAMIRFPLASKPASTYRFGLRIEESAPGGAILDVPSRRFAPLPSEFLTGCKIVAGGSASIGSKFSALAAPAPEPLPGSDSPVLKITYRMDAGWKDLRLIPQPAPLSIAGEPKAFCLWVYDENNGQTAPELRVIDSKRQLWQPLGNQINWTGGWRYVEFDLAPRAALGKNADGVAEDTVQFPLKWDFLFALIKKSQKWVPSWGNWIGQQPLQGTVYLTGPVAIY